MVTPIKYICIEGNIGSGKTSLAKKLAVHLHAKFIGEEFEENPFLPLFYQEPERFAFSLEFSFLLDRARQLQALKGQINSALHVSDYYIEKCNYFASGNLSTEQYAEFEKAYPAIAGLVPEPDLLVFLHLPVNSLQANIKARARAYEQNISDDYLHSVNEMYKTASQKERKHRVLNFHLPNPGIASYNRVFDELCAYLKQPPSALHLSMEIE